MLNKYLLVFLLPLFISCNEEKKVLKVDGLWLVKKVEVGKEIMTPVARWMRFNSDSTQVSGNGWLQHSFGTWNLTNNYLTIKNTNGLSENSEPFKVNLTDSKMNWSREEEGQNVKVFLEKIDKLPISEGNKLMGLWELNYFIKDESKEKMFFQHNETMFLRWDNTYVQHKEGKRKKYGIYKIHGHKPEIQIVNYADKPEFKFYKFIIKDSTLILKSTKGKEELVYSRIHQFPK